MTEQTKSGMRPWLKLLLAVSLALNLVVIGIVAGSAWRFRDGPGKGQRPPMLMGFVFKDLGRKEVNALMLAQAEDGEHPREQHRREFQQIITLLSEETLDSVAIQTIFDSHVVETQGLLHSVARTWVQRLEGMSFEQRLKLAGRMQNHLERGPRRGKGENRDRY